MTMGHSGVTTAQELSDGLNISVASARSTREYAGQVSKLCENAVLKKGTGTAFIEPQYDKLYAHDIPDEGFLLVPQQERIIRTLRIQPSAIAIQKILTDQTKGYMDAKAFAEMGMHMQDAATRKVDVDGLIGLNRAEKMIGSVSSALDFDSIRKAADYLTGNPDEPTSGSLFCVAHRWQITQFDNALAGNVGEVNYGEVTSGLTARTFRNKFRGKVSDVMLYEDDHIDVSGNSAIASVFARESLLCVRSDIMKSASTRLETYGEGADLVIMRDKYQYSLRRPDLWTIQVQSDATAPVT